MDFDALHVAGTMLRNSNTQFLEEPTRDAALWFGTPKDPDIWPPPDRDPDVWPPPTPADHRFVLTE